MADIFDPYRACECGACLRRRPNCTPKDVESEGDTDPSVTVTCQLGSPSVATAGSDQRFLDGRFARRTTLLRELEAFSRLRQVVCIDGSQRNYVAPATGMLLNRATAALTGIRRFERVTSRHLVLNRTFTVSR